MKFHKLIYDSTLAKSSDGWPLFKYHDRVPKWMPLWIRRKVYWLWRRLAKRHVDSKSYCMTEEFSTDDLIQQVKLCKLSIERIWNNQIEMIVCGPRQMAAIEEQVLNKYHPFQVTERFHLAHPLNPDRILGIPIRMIPWFDDILLIPKMEKM